MSAQLSRSWSTAVLSTAMALGLALAASLGAAPGIEADAKAEGAKPAGAGGYFVDNTILGGAERYLAHVSTDKPIYKVGEQVYVRVVVLNAQTHVPLTRDIGATIEVRGPKGDTVATGYVHSEAGVLGFAWPVTEGLNGGEYTVGVNFPEGLPPAERKIDLRIYRAPRLKSQIDFARDGYGAGDTVSATLQVERAEGGFPSGANVRVSARVDDREVFSGTTRVDAKGRATTSFALPKAIERGEGTLAMTIEDGGVVETATKTLPILVTAIDIAMFPEGGELVTGLPGWLYVEARTPAKKPADLDAEVIDKSGKAVASFATEHEGRGRVSFTPEKGQSYSLRIVKPSGIARTFPLPVVKASGAVLHAKQDVIGAKDPARFEVTGSKPGAYLLTVQQRERRVGSQSVTVGSGGWFSRGGPGTLQEVSIALPEDLEGVLVATVWGEGGVPLAERLVFRRPGKGLEIQLKAQRATYVPGGKVEVEVTTTDSSGKPVAAGVGITVTDESVLEMIERRDRAPRLLAMAFLEPEVRELADAHVYLDPNNKKAPRAMDLLLATQGWRRFALRDLSQFVATHGSAARRAFAMHVYVPPPVQDVPMAMGAGFDAGVELRRAPRGAGRGGAVNRPGVAQGMPPAPPPRPAPVPVVAPAPPPKAERALRQRVNAGPPPEPAGKREMQKAAELADRRERDEMMIAEEEAPAVNNMVFVREYAHVARPGRQANDRVDFAETLFWAASVRTDAQGKGKISFDLSDAVTAFSVAADGVSPQGGLGSATLSVKSVQPFYLEPKMPLQITAGDLVRLPVALVNGTDQKLAATLALRPVQGLSVEGAGNLELAPGARGRQILSLGTGRLLGSAELVLTGTAGTFSDQVTRTLEVKAQGFPIEVGQGGLLEAHGTQTVPIELPVSIVQGSVSTEVTVYPTPLANLTQALTRLMQEPNGCFEQTSSTTYPLTMAQQYFTTHQGVDPALVKQSSELLDRGYQRLTGFECKEKGYEWFGEGAGHEALTAYGLMQFGDMGRAKLAMLDRGMLERTRGWLLSRRDGKGGFQRNQKALDAFGGAPEDTTNAYIVWALVESGEKQLGKEVAALGKLAAASSDSYVVALAANVLNATGDLAGAAALAHKLSQKQGKNGEVAGAKTSITQSGGEALLIETTALATLAWLKHPKLAGHVEKSIEFLATSCESGRFGSTQATVLALKAIVAYDAARARPKASGSIQLTYDGKPVGAPVAFDKNTEGALVLPSFASMLTSGKHQIGIVMTGGSPMPFSVSLRYNALTPVSAAGSKLSLSTSLRDTNLSEGKVTELRVEVANVSKEDAATPVAIIGVPAGLEVRHDQLKELKKAGTIATYEVLGREVVLYWRQLKAGQKVSLPISLLASIPGRYTAPASRAYEYYTDENKIWVAGSRVEIASLP